jgi:hypothetical protein
MMKFGIDPKLAAKFADVDPLSKLSPAALSTAIQPALERIFADSDAARLAKVSELNGTQSAVYGVLMDEYQTDAAIAAALEMQPPRVRHALRQLAQIELAEKGPHGRGYRRRQMRAQMQ